MITTSPEIFSLAAEVSKKAEGFTFERWLTLAGFLLSAVLGIVTLLKFLKERREAKDLASSISFKAPAEKERILIDTTQSAVLVMEQAVRTAREEADRYKVDLLLSRAEVESLKEKLRVKDERIDELEDRLRAIQFELKQAMKELASLREDPDGTLATS